MHLSATLRSGVSRVLASGALAFTALSTLEAQTAPPPAGQWQPHAQPYGPPAAAPSRMAGPPRQVVPGTQPPAGIRVADATANSSAPAAGNQEVASNLPARPTPPLVPPGQPGVNEHPLQPALRWAEDALRRMEQIQDYSCTLVKRERIDGELLEHNYMYLKVRHRPFSVYMYFLKPDSLKGQECIWVEGRNEGNLLAHGNGLKERVIGTVALDPTGMLAMKGNRYPIYKVGILNLIRELLVIGKQDTQFGECDVQFYQGVKFAGRPCTMMEVKHPVPRRNFRFHIARICVDEELNLPLHYEAYLWPRTPGGQPELDEEYSYVNLKLNNGFTDDDFDTRNPAYRFR